MARIPVVLFVALTALAGVASAQQPDPAARLAAQVEAMKVFAMMDGVWRGPAMVVQADGTKLNFTQTERIGPFLGGSVKLLEGRGYDDATGKVRFNALGVVSYDNEKSTYTLHSYAMGYAGDFAFRFTGDGYAWEIPMGPASLRYVATVKDGELHEVGDRIVPGREPQRVFDMRLKRVADTDWPAAGAVPPK